MSVWGERAADWGYAAGWNLTQITPDLLARAIFDVGAMAGARKGGPEQLRKNLARVLDVHPREVPDRLIIDSMRSYARYWREAFRLPSQNMERLAARLDSCLYGRRNLDASQAEGRGTVIALPHSGNWDMAGVWLAQTYGTFTTVAERLKPESLYRRFLDYRETLGFEVLALTGDASGPYELLAQRLRENRVVCLMADRDLSRSGVPVDFFGAEARMPAGPHVWRSTPEHVCYLRTAGLNRMSGGESASIRPLIPRRAMSRSPHRRWPMSSPPISPNDPRIGTCCSRYGSTICPRSAAPNCGRRRRRSLRPPGRPIPLVGRRNAHRDGLPVLL